MIDARLNIQAAACIDGGDDTAKEARAKYKEAFPKRGVRRMTHLGMLIGNCIQNLDIAEAIPVIYASAYAESSSLENFIDSFPQASPMLFQTSIHPSAVEQALILGQQPIERFYPLTSACNLAGQALENAALLQADSVALLGGEERGTWLCPYGLASDASFAFGLNLSREGEGLGQIRFEKNEGREEPPAVELPALFRSIRDKRNMKLYSPALESWIHIDWK